MRETHTVTVTDDTLMTVREVAERLRCTAPTVHRLLEDGALRGFRLGNRPGTHWRVYADSVDAYLEAQA